MSLIEKLLQKREASRLKLPPLPSPPPADQADLRPCCDSPPEQPREQEKNISAPTEQKNISSFAIPLPSPPRAPCPILSPGSQPAASGGIPRQTAASEPISLVSTWVLTGCTAACLRCLSCWYVEQAWSDGSVDLRCYTCKAEVTGDLYPHAADERRAELAARREADDAAIVVKGQAQRVAEPD